MKKNILITGTSGGIGLATVKDLAKKGYHVYACVRSQKDVDMWNAQQLPGVTPIILDVAKKEHITQAVAMLNGALSEDGLYALVNNAGINYVAPFEFHEEDKYKYMMEVNVFGLTAITRAVLPLLQQYHKKSGKSARIINIGSIGSAIGLPWEFGYHASKFAVLGISMSWRYELDALGIKTTCIMPGGISTDFFDKTSQEALESLKLVSGDNEPYYRKNMENMVTLAIKLKPMATTPETVAKAITRTLGSSRPPLKKLVGVDAKVLYTIVRLGLWSILRPVFVLK